MLFGADLSNSLKSITCDFYIVVCDYFCSFTNANFLGRRAQRYLQFVKNTLFYLKMSHHYSI